MIQRGIVPRVSERSRPLVWVCISHTDFGVITHPLKVVSKFGFVCFLIWTARHHAGIANLCAINIHTWGSDLFINKTMLEKHWAWGKKKTEHIILQKFTQRK